MKTPRTRPRRLLHLAGPLAVLAALPASAQTANPASNATSNTAADTPSNAAAEATVDLQPFEVSDTATTGYQTNETLAGTRLRTNLADIASSLLVFTPDMLNDLAATNEMDVMRYSSAAEQDRTDQTAAVQDILPLQGVFNFRIRGEAATRALNYFETNIIPNTFDTETIEEANGPNAILFGSGAAGGIYNTSTKRASIGQDATVLGIVLSSDQDTRATVDINRTVVPDHLALRVNVLDEHGQGWQPYADSNNLGAALAATWKPTDRLSVTVNSLYEDISEPMTRDFAPFDEVSLWRASGSPEVATGQITATPALAAEGITARAAGMEDVTFVGNSGSYRNFQGTAVSLPESPTANASNNTLFPSVWYEMDPSDPYPQNANFSGPGARVNDVEGGYQMSIDFQPVDHLFLDFSSDYDALQNHIYDWVGSEGYGTSYDSVFGEPGQTFRDGSPNPYVGDYYIDGRWVYRDTHTYSTRYRLTADYELDAGKTWGRHSLVGLLSRDFTAAPATTEFLGLAGSPFNASPFAPANLIYVRQYISNPSDLYQWAVPSWQQIVNQPVSVALNKGAAPSAYQAVWIDDSNSDPQTIERAGMLSLQDHFLDDRIVTTFGFRRTLFSGWNTPTNFTSAGNDAGTYGIVFKATPWLSAFYNFSQNAVAPSSVQLVIPNNDLFPLNTGEGDDYGLMFRLLNGRLFVRLGYYNTSSENEAATAEVGVDVVTRNQDIVAAEEAAGIAVPADVANINGGAFDLSDVATHGAELNATANLTDHWRLMFDATDSESMSTDLLKLTTQTQKLFLPVWENPAAQNLVTATGNTVAQEIALYDEWYESGIAGDGKSTVGHSRVQARLFTRYDFSSGRLKGVYVGGGYIYSSSIVIGYNTTTFAPYTAQGQREADGLLGYSLRLPARLRRFSVDFQLNGYNLLDRNQILPINAQGDGQIVRAVVLAPATWAFTTKIGF